MTFQVLFKTTNDPTTGAHSWDLGTREVAEAFVQRSDVWWYAFPLDDDVTWRKGGAWSRTQPEEPVIHGVFPHQEKEVPSPRPFPPAAPDDDDDEDRW